MRLRDMGLACVALVMLCCGSVGFGQTPDEVREEEPARAERADQPDRPDRQVHSDRAEDTHQRQIEAVEQLEDEIFEQLDLDDDQAADIEDLFTEFIEQQEGSPEDRREDARERAEDIRALVQELRDAQRNGEQDRAAELRRELADMRRGGGATGGVDQLLGKIREVLYEDQFADYDRLVQHFRENLRQKPDRGDAGIRRMQRAIRMVNNLTPEQRETLRDIVVESLKEIREQRASDKDLADIEAQLHDDIVAELDPEQVDSFEDALKQLERAEAAGKSSPRESRRERPARRPTDDRATEAPPVEEAPHEDMEAVDAPIDEPVIDDEAAGMEAEEEAPE